MDRNKEIQELFRGENYKTLTLLIESLDNFFVEKSNMIFYTGKLIDFELFDKLYFEEVKKIAANVSIYFGKTLKELKCVITDDEGLRKHEIYIQYSGSRKYVITSVNLPHLPYQDKEYNSINEILLTFRNHINSLSNYFMELDRIDQYCSVMEPPYPTYKDDYRKILVDDRTWLHFEVTPTGTATNIHLIGQSELWQDKLEVGLLSWDHDKDIIDNIMIIFDISEFPLPHQSPFKPNSTSVTEKEICQICLCNELPDHPGIPQPICKNTTCGVYFHRSCLYEWLLACSGGRPPAFGVANGCCPTCLHPITCSEKDDGTN